MAVIWYIMRGEGLIKKPLHAIYMSAEHQGKGGENPRVLLSRTIASCALLLLVAGTNSCNAAVVFSAAEDFSLLLDEVVALDEDVGQYLVCAENYTEAGTTTVAVQYHSISAVGRRNTK